MGKRCIFCGKEIETRISMYTDVFIVNLEPCVCSECVIELSDLFLRKTVN